MKTNLLQQIITLRKSRKLRVAEMPMLTGLNRQQYGKIEKGGNPSLSTLDKIAEGLEASILLIPKEKLQDVMKVLQGGQVHLAEGSATASAVASNTEIDVIKEPFSILETDD